MKTKYILKGLLVAILLTFTFTSCSYDEPVIDELAVNREFAPVALTARVRNQTIVELNWTVNKNVDHYVVEFSADDPDFNIIFKTVEVTADQLPIQIQLEGLTEYSIRVKAVSAQGRGDSTWAIVTATTLSEQLMLPFEPCGVIQYNEATLRWQPGINVTHIMIQPGDITHNISAQEKADGIAEVTGLVGETDYMATLYNNDKIRGTATFTSEVDPATGTVINTTNDLLQMIASAASGDILLLEPGDYTVQTGAITLDKSITIRGLLSCDKPLLSVNFEIIGGATDVNLIDLDLDGGTVINDVVRYKGAGNYNSLLVRGCNVHDFARSFIAGSVTDAIVQSVTVENCVVTNILTGGGDFIDFRTSDALNLTVKTSTFNNCAPGRDFLRFDNAGASNNTGLTINILIDSCTLYACSNKDDRRILYVRFVSNDVTVRNTLIAETESEGYADRDGIDESPTFNNNNYFNAEGFYNANQHTYDDGNYTTLDPGFVDAASGNFTVTNQTLLDNAVGDPRWRL